MTREVNENAVKGLSSLRSSSPNPVILSASRHPPAITLSQASIISFLDFHSSLPNRLPEHTHPPLCSQSELSRMHIERVPTLLETLNVRWLHIERMRSDGRESPGTVRHQVFTSPLLPFTLTSTSPFPLPPTPPSDHLSVSYPLKFLSFSLAFRFLSIFSSFFTLLPALVYYNIEFKQM